MIITLGLCTALIVVSNTTLLIFPVRPGSTYIDSVTGSAHALILGSFLLNSSFTRVLHILILI